MSFLIQNRHVIPRIPYNVRKFVGEL